jgi:hypothetical protein
MNSNEFREAYFYEFQTTIEMQQAYIEIRL